MVTFFVYKIYILNSTSRILRKVSQNIPIRKSTGCSREKNMQAVAFMRRLSSTQICMYNFGSSSMYEYVR